MSDSIRITWAALLTAFVVIVVVLGLQGCAVQTADNTGARAVLGLLLPR